MREEDRSLYKRRRIDSRLGLAMLARLDRMVETQAPQNGGRLGEEMLAQIIAGDWPGFLSIFDAAENMAPAGAGAETAMPDTAGADAGDAEEAPEGMAAALALWLAGREAGLGDWYRGGLAAAALLFLYELWLIRRREPAACFQAFNNNHYVGMVVFIGLALDYLYRGGA